MKALVATLALAAVAVLQSGCSTLPPLEPRTPTTAITATQDTALGKAIAPRAAEHPGKAGVHALAQPTDAFAARILLAAAAQRTLDVQYYIWHGDETGYLMFEAAWQAAERGVRVRLLVDDNNTGGLDETLAALDAHPNLEVRLYNPLAIRGMRVLNYATDFTRVNRRMHNKSLTADNQATIVGGRNIGNEYFGAGDATVFADLDVLLVGPSVREVSGAFDLYWNSGSAYPAAALVGPPPADARAWLQQRFAATRASPAAAAYIDAVKRTPLVTELLAGKLALEWADARLVYDDPAKTLGKAERSELLITRLEQVIGKPQRALDVVSPYFVPGETGTAAFARIAREGVKVRVLTNSLAATDVAAVHAGYAKRRNELLASGIELFELKPSAYAERVREAEGRKLGGSSSASLHAKTFSVDRERVFVGSFNFDPRSAQLNTEMGLVIDSPTLARGVSEGFDSLIPRFAYEVRQDTGGLVWIERAPDGEKRYTTEPETGAVRRGAVGVMSVLPIEWLL